MAKVAEEISQKKILRRTSKKLYKGELQVQHGIKEANDFIRRGKYLKRTDKDGDTYCIKSFDIILCSFKYGVICSPL